MNAGTQSLCLRLARMQVSHLQVDFRVRLKDRMRLMTAGRRDNASQRRQETLRSLCKHTEQTQPRDTSIGMYCQPRVRGGLLVRELGVAMT